MIYWKGGKIWVVKLLEHPEIMTQGETLEELEENMKDAYMLMTMYDVPENHNVKELTLAEAVELTDDEKRLIDERLEAYHKNPDSGSPWKDFYKRILSRQ